MRIIFQEKVLLKKNYAEIIEIEEKSSALRGFAKQYEIKGIISIGPKTFLKRAKPFIRKVLKNNRETKVRLILSCFMVKDDISDGSPKISASKIYDTLIAEILERLENYTKN